MTTMLPPIPAAFGRLSDVFQSCLQSVLGSANALEFRASNRVICILVDGLGHHNLKAAGGHAPFLNSKAGASKPIACGFPSTTATSITSFATGVPAGIHGFVGYKVFDRASGKPLNLLNGWNNEFRAETWQSAKTVSELASESGVKSIVIGPPAYEGSGFTNATMRAAEYLGGRSISDRFELAAKLLRSDTAHFICYLYVPELDQIAHSAGVGSFKWLEQIEVLDAEVRKLAGKLRPKDGLVLTADHGVVDVKPHQHILLDELAIDWPEVQYIAGDPRVNFIYLRNSPNAQDFAAVLQTQIGSSGVAVTRKQAVAAGWFGGEVTELALERMPDIFLLAVKNVAYYHRDFCPPASLSMVGQHGGLSAVEMMVPLLRWNL